MQKKAMGSVLLMVAFLTGCSGDPDRANEEGGGLTGALAGGLLGSTVGHGSGRVLSAVGGAILGDYVGSQVGKSMDDTNRQKVNDATFAAMSAPTNQTQSWYVDDARGHIVPTSDVFYYQNHPCRRFKTEVINPRDRRLITGVACFWSDYNTWFVVNEIRHIRYTGIRPPLDPQWPTGALQPQEIAPYHGYTKIIQEYRY